MMGGKVEHIVGPCDKPNSTFIPSALLIILASGSVLFVF